MSRNMHKYEELTPYEFNKEKERASIVYVAAGPLEYHEECNALGIDPCKGYQWCLDAAEITGGIVFPLLPIAPAGSFPSFTRKEIQKCYSQPLFDGEYKELTGMYPGIFFSRQVCRSVYQELLEAFALEMKFKLCVFIGSHGPAGSMLKDIVSGFGQSDCANLEGVQNKNVGDFHGMRVMAVWSADYNRDVIRNYYTKNDIFDITRHGGLWESALNWAVNPEYFQPEYLDETKYPQHYGALKDEHFEGCQRPSKSEYTKFTPEFANEMHNTTVKRLADDVLNIYKNLK